MREKLVNILLVEDDSLTMQTSKRLLRPFGKIFSASTEEEAYKVIQENSIDLAFFDLNLHGELSGLKLITFARLNNIYSIVLSGEAHTKVLEKAYVNGARDYLIKPFNQAKLSTVMNHYFNYLKSTEFENIINKSFITKSQELTEELYKIKNLGVSDKPIFIHGETGTGKRVIAHLIQKVLENDNFIELNCSQYTDELFASELFGHKKGAFTGANENKVGVLEKAHNGIVFLDEIHSLSLKAQKTLLKAIEEKEFYPVGSNTKIKSNFRVVSATCEDIEVLIEQSEFREDLFARINTFNIKLSPLRKRKEDILLLLQYFISKQLIQIVITDEAKKILEEYSWPRNTREIQDLVENWVINGNRLITADILPNNIKNNFVQTNKVISEYHLDLVEEYGLTQFLIMMKKEIIEHMIKRNNGVLKRASKVMNASYPNLSAFLKTHKNKSFSNRRIK